ncbi:MAG: hypothetical protein ACLGG0_12720 [Bacteriovoracia bacterium]
MEAINVGLETEQVATPLYIPAGMGAEIESVSITSFKEIADEFLEFAVSSLTQLDKEISAIKAMSVEC